MTLEIWDNPMHQLDQRMEMARGEIESLRAELAALKAAPAQEPVARIDSPVRPHNIDGLYLAEVTLTKRLDQFTDLYTHPAPAVPEKESAAPVVLYQWRIIGQGARKEWYDTTKIWYDKHKDNPQYKFRVIHAHPAPAVPEGWKLVPIEPTEEMIVAITRFNLPENNYKAMLSAAPEPKL